MTKEIINPDQVHEDRIAALVAEGKTKINIRDSDNEAWNSGFAKYLLDNYSTHGLHDAFVSSLIHKIK